MARGGCNCGAVSFEISAELSDVYVCHCSVCRRWTGANGVPIVLVANDDFRWTSGEDHIGRWQHPEKDWLSAFCKTCGSTLPGPNDDTHTFVPAGLITEGGDDLEVRIHIWTKSRAHWDVIGDDGVQHPKAFGSAS